MHIVPQVEGACASVPEGACASVPVEEEGGVTAEDLCTAYCSLAEVYLTDSWSAIVTHDQAGTLLS